MAGFMDYFTGGGAGSDFFGGDASGVNDLLTAQQQEAIKRQSMMAMAAQLLQAGGPSAQRVGLGQALGQGFMAGQQAQEKGTTGAVNQMLLRSKLDEAKRAQALAGQIRGVFAEGMPTQQDAALAAPESVAGAPGPTMQRAALAQAPTAQVNPRLAQAEQYRRAAALSAGDPAKAKTYMDIADMLSPREKVTGQPFEVTDATGKPVMVQQMESGELRTMAGFGPKRDVVLQSFGGRTVAIDKSQLKGGESYEQTMTPGEIASNAIAQGNLGISRANLGLRQAEFARGANEIKETPTGFAYVPKVPGGVAVPVMGAGGIPLEGGKEAPAEFTKTVKKLNDLKGNLSAYKKEVESDKTVFPSSIPLPFGAGAVPLPTGADTARVRGKYQSLLMGVKDLYDLGALTGPDMGIIEQQLTNPASFSGAFTSRAAMGEQIKVLEDMVARSEENISTAFKRKIPAASTAKAPQPARPARLVKDPVTGVYRYVTE